MEVKLKTKRIGNENVEGQHIVYFGCFSLSFLRALITLEAARPLNSPVAQMIDFGSLTKDLSQITG